MAWAWLCLGVVVPALEGQHAATPPDFAAAGEQASKLQLGPGLNLSVWAAEPQLSNGVAFHFDNAGRCFVAETHRWSTSVFDITHHTNWLLADMSFHDVGERVAFLESRFAATEPDLLTRDSELVRMLEDLDGDGKADASTVLATGFDSPADGTAAGILSAAGRIYFANIPNLWSLPVPAVGAPAPPDPAKGPRERLATGFGVHIGVSGHDLHGLIRGPDGRIYLSFGDRGLCVTNREGRVLNVPDCGGVLRCEADGRNLEVFCMGLRNPQELAFDDEGNLWTADNDTAGADPCRVLHLVEDGDYGWRTSYQHAPGFGPWVLEELWKGGLDGILPPAGTASQGPSGLAFYPGTGFGDRLKGAFLHCDFPGGVVSFTVKPRGASFEVDRKEKFLWGCWPTDVDFGPDGAAYAMDWVAGWGKPMKGRIYRVTARDADPRSGTVKRLLGEGMTRRNETELLGLLGNDDRRVRLEAQWELASRGTKSFAGLRRVAFSGAATPARLHAVWGIGQIVRAVDAGTPASRGGDLSDELFGLVRLLDDADAAVRGQTARLLGDAGLANADLPLAAMLDDPSPAAAFHATMALGTLAVRHPRGHWSPAQKTAGMLAQKLPRIGRVVSGKVSPDPAFHPAATAVGAAMTNRPTTDPFLRHARVRQWRNQEIAEATGPDPMVPSRRLRDGRGHPSEEVRLADVLVLRQSTNAYLTNFLSDPMPEIVVAAGRAIHDVPVPEGFPALAALITRVDCPTNLMSRVIAAGYRLGTAPHAQMLAGFAKRRDVPDWARAKALDALADWGRPPALDKVNGLWRPLVGDDRRGLPADLGRSATHAAGIAAKRNPQPAIRAFLRVADEILDPNTPDEVGIVVPGAPPSTAIQLAVLDAGVRLKTKELAHPFHERFLDTNTASELRRRIVPALAALNASQTADAVRAALGDRDPAVLASAVPHLDRLEAGVAVPILARLAGVATNAADVPASALRPAQAAIAALAGMPGADAAAVLMPLAERLAAGTLPPALRADVWVASRARAEPGFRERVSRHDAALAKDDPLARWRMALAGGDAAKGAEIFRGNAAVQCVRCHKVAGDGGTVGPLLDGIGGKKPREYLLEAIVSPNRAYAEGYRPPQGGLSAMPEGLAELLSPLELRDVVEFLGSLR